MTVESNECYEERAELAVAAGDLKGAAYLLRRAGYDTESQALFEAAIMGSPPPELFGEDYSAPKPAGTFYDAAGQSLYNPPLSSRAEPPTKENQYGLLLNAYGERGNRLLWLSYTNGRRQQS